LIYGFEEFADSLTSLTDAESIWKNMEAFVDERGYECCNLMIASDTQNGLQSHYMRSNTPAPLLSQYHDEGLIKIDPLLLFGCDTASITRLSSNDMTCFPKATSKHQAMFDYASSTGMQGGFAVPVRTSDCELFGGWSFGSSESVENIDRLHHEFSKDIHLASVLAYERMVVVGVTKRDFQPVLSNREKECLRWLCAGLRVSMIANKLSISESAVNLYISNAKHKLDAKTREQAIARAILGGEINL